MNNQKQVLSSSNIKYLLVLNELNRDKNGVRCVDVAKTLRITKPSVYAMMNTLKGMDLICKDKYGIIILTEQGQNLADLYSSYFEMLCLYFDKLLPKDADIKSVTCALLAELSIESLKVMCDRIRSDL